MTLHKFDHNNYPKAWVKIRPSQIVIGEVGAFALRDFKKDEVIVRSEEFEDNNVMDIEEYNKLDEYTKELVKAHSTITVDTVFMPANINYIRPINYWNHSCDPNTGFNERGDYVAMRDISKGEEFFLDYSFLNTNPDYKILCRCNSKNCRKIITGNEWKNSDFVNKNYSYLYSGVKAMLEKR